MFSPFDMTVVENMETSEKQKKKKTTLQMPLIWAIHDVVCLDLSSSPFLQTPVDFPPWASPVNTFVTLCFICSDASTSHKS